MQRACLDCGAPSDQNRCPKHRAANRRARKDRGLTGARGSTRASRKLRATVLERDGHRCHWCGAHADTDDHLIPLALGGSDAIDNHVASCRPCNAAKGDKAPEIFAASEWLRRRRQQEGGAGQSRI